MKKKLILLIILLLVVLSIVFVSYNIQPDEALTVKEFNQLEIDGEFKVVGNLALISFNSFIIVDIEFPEEEITFSFDQETLSLESFAVGETVLVIGEYNDTYLEYMAKEIKKVDEQIATRHVVKRNPILEISIVDYPTSVKNNCESVTIVTNIKNNGEITIKYSDIYDETFGYSIIYRINENEYFYPSIEDFGSLEPKEQKEVQMFVNAGLEFENNKMEIVWGKRSIYEQEFTELTKSSTMNININNENCE